MSGSNNKKKKILKLKKMYNIPEKVLYDLKLLQPENYVMCGNITHEEHEKLLEIVCASSSKTDKSKILRNRMIDFIKNNEIINESVFNELKKLRVEKLPKEHPISFLLEEKYANAIDELCRKNYLHKYTVIRYCVQDIIRTKEKK